MKKIIFVPLFVICMSVTAQEWTDEAPDWFWRNNYFLVNYAIKYHIILCERNYLDPDVTSTMFITFYANDNRSVDNLIYDERHFYTVDNDTLFILVDAPEFKYRYIRIMVKRSWLNK